MAALHARARTSLFRLINIQNRALCASLAYRSFAALPGDFMMYRENTLINPSWEKLAKVC